MRCLCFEGTEAGRWEERKGDSRRRRSPADCANSRTSGTLKLEQLGLDQKTVLFFSSDNGPEDYHIRNAANAGVGSPGPHRGRKRSIYEGGVRQPLVVCWPGKIKAGVFDEASVIGAVDFFPTVCALTGVAPPGNAELDGEDVSDILLGGQSRPRQKPLFWEWRSRVAGNPDYTPPPIAVRGGPWKLLTDADRSRVGLLPTTTRRSCPCLSEPEASNRPRRESPRANNR